MNYNCDWIINRFLFARQNNYAVRELDGFTGHGSWNSFRSHQIETPNIFGMRKQNRTEAILSHDGHRSRSQRVFICLEWVVIVGGGIFFFADHIGFLSLRHIAWSSFENHIDWQQLCDAVACAIFTNRKCATHSRAPTVHSHAHLHTNRRAHSSVETTQIELQNIEIRWRLSDHFFFVGVCRNGAQKVEEKKSSSINLNKQNSRPKRTVSRPAKPIRALMLSHEDRRFLLPLRH